MKKSLLMLSFLVLAYSVVSAGPHIYEKKYHGFTVWLDCHRHGAVAFYYELDKDEGNIPRKKGRFKTDRSVPETCQPTSVKSYRTDAVDSETGTWDRGHLVPANHMDNNLVSLKDTFFLTNILPQQSTFNQSKGAWHETEKISECYRDISRLSIWGGLIWGEDASNDFFVTTHNVTTPDFWWKVIYRHDTQSFIAWIFPNAKTSKAANIDEFIVTIRELKTRLEFVPDFGEIEKFLDDKPAKSWEVTGNKTLTCEGQSTSIG